MSSRLFTEVRGKRGLAYYVGASFDVGTDCGVLTIKAGVTNNKTEEALRATVTELKRIKKEAVGGCISQVQSVLVPTLVIKLTLSAKLVL